MFPCLKSLVGVSRPRYFFLFNSFADARSHVYFFPLLRESDDGLLSSRITALFYSEKNFRPDAFFSMNSREWNSVIYRLLRASLLVKYIHAHKCSTASLIRTNRETKFFGLRYFRIIEQSFFSYEISFIQIQINIQIHIL